MSLRETRRVLRGLASPEIAEHSQRFFKTGKGEYGEGDKFLGIRVPVLRKLVRVNAKLELSDITELLKSSYHEERLFSLLLLVEKFRIGTNDEKQTICRLYLDHTRYINNWDLVDSSAHLIVGSWLENKNKSAIYALAKSENLWERRIAIISTFWFIRKNKFADTLKVSRLLIHDTEDLIHKAVGWMLREIGKRDVKIEKDFLAKYYKKMPRTMLRYAIEKFSESERKRYLADLV
ncbi:MAG: DNA alkylation repair protein [Gammaproteobacteria bacterium]|nr:DNA alkylation repair protein [Gammaproteobacteria bacterium]